MGPFGLEGTIKMCKIKYLILKSFLQNPVIIAFQKLGIISHGRYRSEI